MAGAGRIVRTERCGDHLRVTWRPRGADATPDVEVRRLLDASGVERLSRGVEGPAERLLAGGLARLDAVELSFDVTPELRLIGAAGNAGRPIWALGPMVRGVFWECGAVPEIRVQAALRGGPAAPAILRS